MVKHLYEVQSPCETRRRFIDLIIREHYHHIMSLVLENNNEEGHVAENHMRIFLASCSTRNHDFCMPAY